MVHSHKQWSFHFKESKVQSITLLSRGEQRGLSALLNKLHDLNVLLR